MTPDEEQELRELGAEISAAKASQWLARCLVDAFRPRPAVVVYGVELHWLTFAGWVELEHIRSPYLHDDWKQMPELEHVAAALGAMSGQPITVDWVMSKMQPEQVLVAISALREIVAEAFSTALSMRKPPGACGSEPPTVARADNDGFGSWMQMVALLSRMMGRTPAELRTMRVSQGFALIATDNHLAGYVPRGANYLERDVVLSKNADFLDPVPDQCHGSENRKHDEQEEQAEGHAKADDDIRRMASPHDAEQAGNKG